MASVKGLYYDGKSSAGHAIELQFPQPAGETLRITGSGIDRTVLVSDIRVSPRIGNSRRMLYLPDGAVVESADNDAIDGAFANAPNARRHRILHVLESRFRYVVLAVAATAIAMWLVIEFGIPALAREVAVNLPASVEISIGQGALDGLDKLVFKPSKLPDNRKVELRQLFSRIAGDGSGYKLEFRGGGRMGANALALPAGTIVLTDELVALAKRDEEIAAVLAHEVGHLRNRHALRHVMEQSVTGLLIIAVTGDVNTILAAAPLAVIHARYSQAFEREADDFALHYLASQRIDPAVFSDILLRLDAQHPQGGMPSFLASHPATEERAKRARESSK
ncbi:MAG: M48 family metallopeptidase [Betaproteobacteria bacterium]